MATEERVTTIGPLVKEVRASVGPDHNLLEAARRMIAHGVGAAVVLDNEGQPGIITERDLMRAMADGVDLATTHVEEYMTPDAISASVAWGIEEAARRMIHSRVRHLVVLDDRGEVMGMLSIRDLVAGMFGLEQPR
jgi:CBS domain-containing protein